MNALRNFISKSRLPLLVFLAGLILIVNHTLRSHRQNMETQRAAIRQEAAETGAQISGMTQHLFRKNLPRSVDLLVSYASVSPDLEIGLVLDSDDVIRHATRQQWEGVPLSESPFAELAGELIPVRQGMQGQTVIDEKGQTVTAYFPFWKNPDNRSKGMVVLRYNLESPIAIAWNETIHESIAQTFALAAGSLMFWLILSQWNASQRLRRVVDQARTLVQRGERLMPLEGEDELAQFSRSFSDAADRIDETELQLTQLAASIRDVFWFAKNERRAIPHVNFAYEEIWESPASGLATSRWAWLRRVMADDRRKAIEMVRDLHGGVEVKPIEIRLRMSDWRIKWLECRGFSVTAQGGGVRAIGGLVTDISERKNIDRSLMEAAEEERMRIGQDLHDDVCQRMAAAQLKGGILHSSLHREGLPQAELAAEVSSNLAEATEIVRGFAHGLAPVVLEAEGLAPALAQLAGFIERAFGIHCWTTCMDVPDLIDPAATTHLYRIAQELATNAARHAHPEGIGISLSHDGRSMTLQVTNDGTPFDGRPAPSSKGMGLHAVRKHVDALGGRIKFKPSPELLGGTTVVCEFPLSRPSASKMP